MADLKELMLKKEELYNDESISDEMYYYLVEQIDNKIANEYTIEEIEQVEKELM